jgi:hypothetical protein
MIKNVEAKINDIVDALQIAIEVIEKNTKDKVVSVFIVKNIIKIV